MSESHRRLATRRAVQAHPLAALALVLSVGGVAWAAAAAARQLEPSAIVAALGGSLWTGPFLVAPLLLLFPGGRLRFPGWRVAVAAAALGGVAVLLVVFAVGATMVSTAEAPSLVVPLAAVGLLLGGFVAGLVHLVLRHRSAGPRSASSCAG